MTKILITIVVLLVSACNKVETSKKVIQTYSDGQPQKEKIYFNPKDTLQYKEVTYFQNGKIKSEYNFYNGRFNGKIVDFYINGQKKFEGNTAMSYFIGEKINYDENGKLSQVDSLNGKCHVTNCCCDGVVTRFYPNGKIKEKWTNKSGLINGLYQSYYANGQKELEGNMINDNKDGIFSRWYEDGSLDEKISYNAGVEHGPTIEYFKKRGYNIHGQYKNGKEEGEWKYIDSLGNIKRTDVYKEGILIKPGKKIKN